MKKKIVITFILLFSISTVAGAWSWHGLKPGDHVIDYKRLADSIKETVQMFNTVQNSLENLKNKIIINTKINVNEDKIDTEIKEIIKPNGESLINPNRVFRDKNFYKSWDVHKALADSDYNLELAEEQSYTKKEATDVLQETIYNQHKRMNLQSEILNMQTNGVLGEKQRANAIAIIDILNSIDKAKTSGAYFINNITDQETKSATNRLDKEKIKAGQFYGYDPYNPSTFDKEKYPQQKPALGFMHFGK